MMQAKTRAALIQLNEVIDSKIASQEPTTLEEIAKEASVARTTFYTESPYVSAKEKAMKFANIISKKQNNGLILFTEAVEHFEKAKDKPGSISEIARHAGVASSLPYKPCCDEILIRARNVVVEKESKKKAKKVLSSREANHGMTAEELAAHNKEKLREFAAKLKRRRFDGDAMSLRREGGRTT